MVSKMHSCIKILKSSVAACFLAIECASIQVAAHSSGNFCSLEIITASGARWISGQPSVKTYFTKECFALAALFRLPNDICANRANAAVPDSLSDPLIG